MSKNGWWWVGSLSAGAVLLLLVAPIVLGLYRNGHHAAHPLIYLSDSWATYGTWINGITTPVLLVVAIITFMAQRKASEEQSRDIRSQINHLAASNKISARANFIQHMQSYSYRIDELCESAIWGGIPTYKDRDDLTYVQSFIKISQGTEIPKAKRSIAEIRSGIHYATLCAVVHDFITSAEENDSIGLVDLRIRYLQVVLRTMEPTLSSEPDGFNASLGNNSV
jgi:hypothetical protein